MGDTTTVRLDLPVREVTLDADLVARVVAKVLRVEDDLATFAGSDTKQSQALGEALMELYTAAFGEAFPDSGMSPVFQQIQELADNGEAGYGR